MNELKCITLDQPYASLAAARLKGVETRSWLTHYRGPVLIHASVKWGRAQFDVANRIRGDFPHSWETGMSEHDRVHGPPLGVVLAATYVLDVRLMTEEWIAQQTPLERAVGDWQLGRYGWVLGDVARVDPPILVRGRQGLWTLREREVTKAGWERLAAACREATPAPAQATP